MANNNTKKVKLTVGWDSNTERDKEDPNFLIGINGVNYLIPKGKPVDVPDFVAEEYHRSRKALTSFFDNQSNRATNAQNSARASGLR